MKESLLFPSEAELVQHLIPLLPSLFPDHGVVATEVVARLGIADVVVARPSAEAFARRVYVPLAPVLVPGAVQLISAIDGCSTTDEVFERAGLSPAYGRRLLRSLRGTGHLLEKEPWALSLDFCGVFDSLVAIEAKLVDWRRAIAQASRYLTFAQFSYVAVPATLRRRVDEDLVKGTGLGLIYVESGFAQVAVCAPSSCAIEPWRRLLVSETLVATGMRLASSCSSASSLLEARRPSPAGAPRAH